MEEILKNFQEVFMKNKPNVRIRILRRQKNFTIKQMAEKCITTEKAWSDWESGKVIPRKINKKRIARALGVDEKTIFGVPEIYVYLLR